MNAELEHLASTLALSSLESRPLALAFGLACARRIEHLLEQQAVVECLNGLAAHVSGMASSEQLEVWAAEAARLASQHRGSNSIDGCGHAAVSATYGVSKAVAGKALEAAHYCAYAAIYASGGYAAVAEVEAFEPEVVWQLSCLRRLALQSQAEAGARPAKCDA